MGQGHRRIALVGGLEHFDPAAMRFSGYQRGLEDAGLPFEPKLVRSWGMGRQAAYAATRDLMADTPPTALIAGGNLILAGVLQALKEMGVVIGRELALVGCDDTDLYAAAHAIGHRYCPRPGGGRASRRGDALTTIEQGEAQAIMLPTRLEVRDSSLCGPRPSISSSIQSVIVQSVTAR